MIGNKSERFPELRVKSSSNCASTNVRKLILTSNEIRFSDFISNGLLDYDTKLIVFDETLFFWKDLKTIFWFLFWQN